MQQTLNLPKFIVGIIGILKLKDKYLILKRSNRKDTNSGVWEVVAGKMEYGESPQETLEREVFEESGYRITAPQVPIYVAQAKRGSDPMILLYYVCDVTKDEVKLSSEHSEFAWVEAEEVLNYIKFSEFEKVMRLVKNLEIV